MRSSADPQGDPATTYANLRAPWVRTQVFEFPPVLGWCPGCHTRLFADDEPVRHEGRLFHPECAAFVRGARTSGLG